jgi:hypothetical protein
MPVPTPEILAAREKVGLSAPVDESVPIATLESLRAALRIPVVEQSGVGVWRTLPGIGRVFIGRMSSAGYDALDGVPVYTAVQGAKISSVAKDKRKRKEILLEHGILEPKLAPEDVQALLNQPGIGPAVEELIADIASWNPTIQEQQDEIKLSIAGNRVLFMIWRVMRESGALPDLAKRLTGREDAYDALISAVMPFEVLLEVEDTARAMNVSLEAASYRVADEAAERLSNRQSGAAV